MILSNNESVSILKLVFYILALTKRLYIILNILLCRYTKIKLLFYSQLLFYSCFWSVS